MGWRSSHCWGHPHPVGRGLGIIPAQLPMLLPAHARLREAAGAVQGVPAPTLGQGVLASDFSPGISGSREQVEDTFPLLCKPMALHSRNQI